MVQIGVDVEEEGRSRLLVLTRKGRKCAIKLNLDEWSMLLGFLR